jgi:hypothetical protein
MGLDTGVTDILNVVPLRLGWVSFSTPVYSMLLLHNSSSAF